MRRCVGVMRYMGVRRCGSEVCESEVWEWACGGGVGGREVWG